MFGASNTEVSKNKKEQEQMTSSSPSHKDVKLVEAHTSTENDGTYKAFSSNASTQAQFEIRLRGNRGLFLYYPFITSAEYEGNESLTLISQGTAYIIKGSNFKSLLNHYRTQTIEYIQEFDPAQFDEKPALDATYINEIEIIELKNS